MVLQIPIGLLGLYFHVVWNMDRPMETWQVDFLYGAPVFVPLLFPNRALLEMLGIRPLLSGSVRELCAMPQRS